MTPEKKQRVASAVGFLFGVIASMDVLRDQKLLWPPDALWGALRSPQRLELGGGVALIVVTVILTLARRRSA
jgi:hypothetical protein